MSAHWHNGMEVECCRAIDMQDCSAPPPVTGCRYLISAIFDHGDAITLNFTTLSFAGNAAWSPGYLAEFFRPVTKRPTSIAVFTALLTPTEDEIFREFEAAEFDYDENIVVPR